MTWFERNERKACCDGAGSVSDQEKISRILFKRTAEPLHYEWLPRSELFSKVGFSNECGEQDGLSVDRSELLDDEEIDQRSAHRANVRPNRIPNGALQADVKSVRDLRWLDVDTQVCKVYDDPKNDNGEHAVVRAAEDIPDEDRSIFVRQVRDLFKMPRGSFGGHST
jgi:hypothetical protein